MSAAPQCVLLVDDDAAIRTVLSAQLKQDAIDCIEAASAEEALEKLASGMVDLIVTDLRMPGMDGLELLSRAVRMWPDVPVIVLTAFGSIPIAVDAMRRGAVDFIEKPFDRAGVLYAIRSALGSSTEGREALPSVAGSDDALVGDTPPMVELRHSIQRAASASRATVLIRGENGTGKELVARAVHAQSPRASGPFVTMNCAAIPETLVEAEIFGYVKGAFTGAVKDKPGRVELAHGGTLFLDEIGEYSEATQITLLRILAEHEVRRLGARDSVKVDVRFVAATNKDLDRAMKDGRFREDLYYRLSVLPIVVPSLAERSADIPSLVRHFVARLGEANGRQVGVDKEALVLLSDRPWPGNVRQLENFVERLLVFTDGDVIRRADVEREIQRGASRGERPASGKLDLASAVRETEQAAIVEALIRTNNNRSRAARILGLSRRAFYNKLKDHDLLSFRPPYPAPPVS